MVGSVLLVVLVSGTVEASKIPWWNIKLAQEQGPNVCVVEEVPGTKHRVWTECKYWNSREICGQKPLLRYECCGGYRQVEGSPGCSGVKQLKNVLETASDLGAREFVRYIEESGLGPNFTERGAFTLFAPSDEALKELPSELKAKLDSYRGNRQNLLMYHIVDKRITSPEFKADLLIETRYPGHKLRINNFSSRLETVNCAQILRKDQESTNGVVHIVDSFLDPAKTAEHDLAELVIQDRRFIQLARMMEQSGFIDELRKTQQACTILAPSDEAFQKIPQARLKRIMDNKDAREALLNNHVIPHPLCLPAVVGEHNMRTLGSEKLTLDCDKKGVMAGGRRLRTDFTLGQNGVLYMIDDVLLTDKAKSLIQLIEDEKLDSFLQIIRLAGLEGAFENFGDYTIFAPSEAAIHSIPEEKLQELKTNHSAARKFVLLHVTQGRLLTNTITGNQVTKSMAENPLRLQVYHKVVGVEDALMETVDRECMNGVLHVISKVLVPTVLSAGDILRRNGTYSIFLEAMEKVTSSNPAALTLKGPGTYFVPNDAAFSRLGAERLQRMMGDTVYLTKTNAFFERCHHLVYLHSKLPHRIANGNADHSLIIYKTLKNHAAEGMMTSKSFRPDLHYSIQSKQNILEVVNKEGKLRVNDATMLQCDVLSTNGVLHVINKVLLPEENIN